MEKGDNLLGSAVIGRKEIKIRWAFPRDGWVRLNTDGAAKGNPGRARAGGLIHGHRGEVHEVFALNCGGCSCTRAELYGVMKGLLIAWDGGHRKVQFSVDSEVVVRMLVEETPTKFPYIRTIRRCESLIARRGWEVKIGHCYREGNRAVDWLANYGVDSSEKLVMF